MSEPTWLIPEPDDNSNSARRSRFEILAEWLLMSSSDRVFYDVPLTQSGLAEMFGRSSAAITQWKKSREFQRVMNRNLRQHFGAERLKAVIDNMFDLAISGTPQAVPAARVLMGFLEQQEKEGDIEDEIASLTDEELEMLQVKMAERRDD